MSSPPDNPQMTPVKLSIIIVSYNCQSYLIGCIKSIFEARLPFAYEIIVVDNASSDAGSELVSREFPAITIIQNSDNVGFAQANNQGILRASGECVLFLNNDTVVRAGSIEAMVKRLEEDRTLGAVGCALEDGEGELQVSFGGMLNFTNEFFQKYLEQVLKNYLSYRTMTDSQFKKWLDRGIDYSAINPFKQLFDAFPIPPDSPEKRSGETGKA